MFVFWSDIHYCQAPLSSCPISARFQTAFFKTEWRFCALQACLQCKAVVCPVKCCEILLLVFHTLIMACWAAHVFYIPKMNRKKNLLAKVQQSIFSKSLWLEVNMPLSQSFYWRGLQTSVSTFVYITDKIKLIIKTQCSLNRV